MESGRVTSVPSLMRLTRWLALVEATVAAIWESGQTQTKDMAIPGAGVQHECRRPRRGRHASPECATSKARNLLRKRRSATEAGHGFRSNFAASPAFGRP